MTSLELFAEAIRDARPLDVLECVECSNRTFVLARPKSTAILGITCAECRAPAIAVEVADLADLYIRRVAND